MNAEIEANLPEIKELCERFGVRRLELFGSATGPDFDPETSDFDFLSTFADTGPGTNYGVRFLEFADALERLFKRPIDLVTPDAIRNFVFQREVDSSRMEIYEAGLSLTNR